MYSCKPIFAPLHMCWVPAVCQALLLEYISEPKFPTLKEVIVFHV